jgi:hypothetical protein
MKYLDNDDEDEKCYSLKTHEEEQKANLWALYGWKNRNQRVRPGLFCKQIYNQEHDEKDIQMMIYFVR